MRRNNFSYSSNESVQTVWGGEVIQLTKVDLPFVVIKPSEYLCHCHSPYIVFSPGEAFTHAQ